MFCVFKQNVAQHHTSTVFWLFYCPQVERAPKKHVVEEFEEFDYSDLYDDMSVSTVTAGPNVTEYEVRLSREISNTSFVSLILSLIAHLHLCFMRQIVEYEDYDNTTEYYQVNEYEYEEEYDERYGPAERERELSLNTEVPSKWSVIHKG